MWRTIQNPGRVVRALSLCAVFAWLTWFFHAPYLTGARMYVHDSIAAQANYHLFFEPALRGFSPFWSHELNCGHPTWPVYELVPMGDPVAFGAYPLCKALGVPSNLAYQWCVFVWLSIFASGGMACAFLFTRLWWAGLAVFAALFGGPLALMAVAQSYGFVLPFRYLPWVLHGLHRYLHDPSPRRALSFACVLALSLASYQSGYALAVVLVWALAFVPRTYANALRANVVRLLAIALPMVTLAALPTFIAYGAWSDMEAPGRTFGQPWHASSQLLSRYMATSAEHVAWHGSLWVGVTMPLVILCGGLRGAIALARRRPQDEDGVASFRVFVRLLLVCAAIGTLCFSHFALFLGLRNWGFTLTALILVSSILFAAALPALGRASGVAPLICLVVVAEQSLFLSDKKLTLAEPLARSSLAWDLPVRYPEARRPTLACDALATHSPFTIEAAALRREPVIATSQGVYTHLVSNTRIERCSLIANQLLLGRYHALLALELDTFTLAAYLGVQGPHLVPWTHVRAVPDRAAALALMRTVRVDPPGTASLHVVELTGGESPPAIGTATGDADGAGTVVITRFTPGHVQMRVHVRQASVLVLGENWAPEWKIRVNGRRAAPLIVDVAGLGCLVPPGDHDVEFLYLPIAYIIAFAGRAIVCIASLIFLIRCASRRNTHPEWTSAGTIA